MGLVVEGSDAGAEAEWCLASLHPLHLARCTPLWEKPVSTLRNEEFGYLAGGEEVPARKSETS